MKNEVKKSLEYLLPDRQIVELRALDVESKNSNHKCTVLGYFNNYEDLAKSALELSDKAKGIYFTPNPIREELFSRSPNQTRRNFHPATSDSDILNRKWLLIDIDPDRPSGVSSTDSEHQYALSLARKIRSFLSQKGWPDPVVASSGNGAHLMYHIDLPTKDDGLVKRCLQALSVQFSDNKAKVDTSVYNPARIWKLYGTFARKGEESYERYYRQSKILWDETAKDIFTVDRKLVEKLAIPEGVQPNSENSRHSRFNLQNWINRHNLDVNGPMEWTEGMKWVFNTCPWDSNHINKSAYIIQFKNGAISAGCHHDSCQGNNWHSLRDKYESGWRENTNKQFHNTDIGNAERLIALHGDDIKYLINKRAWIIWDGKKWKEDDDGEVIRRAKETVRSIYSEANRIEDQRKREDTASWAIRSENGQRIKAMIELAKSEKDVSISINQLDSNMNLINCQNGTLDIETGILNEHRREDFITKILPVNWEGFECKSNVWDKFLRQVTNNDEDLQVFLKRSVGYSLLGNCSEEKIFFIHGPGASGKSTFIGAIKSVFEEYTKTTDFSTFLRSSSGKVRNDIARLAGSRIVISVETERGQHLAEGVIKSLSGGDTITVRFLYNEAFEYRPTFTIWLVANDAPEVDSDDTGIWRRIIRLPFDQVIPEQDRDPMIKKQLTDPNISGSAILSWAIEGAKEWLKEGMKIPDIVIESTKAYKAEVDLLAGYFEEAVQLDPNDSDCWESWKVIQQSVENWCHECGEDIPSDKYIRVRLRQIGCKPQKRCLNGYQSRGWQGVTVRDDYRFGLA